MGDQESPKKGGSLAARKEWEQRRTTIGERCSMSSLNEYFFFKKICDRYFRLSSVAARRPEVESAMTEISSYLKDVTWQNITLYDVHNTISIDMFYGHGKSEKTDCPISDIKIINVTAHGNKEPGGRPFTMGKINCQTRPACI